MNDFSFNMYTSPSSTATLQGNSKSGDVVPLVRFLCKLEKKE